MEILCGNQWGMSRTITGGEKKKLLDLAGEILRRKHYSIRTEGAYIGWITRYIFFQNKRHPKDMGYWCRALNSEQSVTIHN